mmetsp:Transcript_4672/g.10298  ORF Transcript_4672/g.10298 Transcript_4672/m.10298 type:complete len:254 (+) Transcript_4672:297-1058(+)
MAYSALRSYCATAISRSRTNAVFSWRVGSTNAANAEPASAWAAPRHCKRCCEACCGCGLSTLPPSPLIAHMRANFAAAFVFASRQYRPKRVQSSTHRDNCPSCFGFGDHVASNARASSATFNCSAGLQAFSSTCAFTASISFMASPSILGSTSSPELGVAGAAFSFAFGFGLALAFAAGSGAPSAVGISGGGIAGTAALLLWHNADKWATTSLRSGASILGNTLTAACWNSWVRSAACKACMRAMVKLQASSW